MLNFRTALVSQIEKHSKKKVEQIFFGAVTSEKTFPDKVLSKYADVSPDDLPGSVERRGRLVVIIADPGY